MLRHPLEQGRQRATVRAHARRRRPARRGRRGTFVLRPRRGAAGQVHHRPSARRLPDVRRPAHRRRRRPRQGPWLRRALRARRLDRADVARRQPVQDDRRTRRARRRAARGRRQAVMAGPPFQTRKTWRNHLGNQSIDPLRIYAPRSIDEVAEIVRAAEEAGVTARAVGSGHSWSDVALTEGFLMKTDRLARVPAPEPDFLVPAWQSRSVVRAEAGIRIKELNAHLDGSGLALPQMGGYDHQTIAGVISTSTHGSGTGYGPLNDFVHSLDMVVSG